MVTSSNDNLLKLASLMIAEIEGFFTSMQVGLRHPVSEFSFEAGRNAFYVIYAGNGAPLKAGVLLSTLPAEERARIIDEVATLERMGYGASYRVLDLGSELLASQIGRILLDLFGATLPLAGGAPAQEVVPASVSAPQPPLLAALAASQFRMESAAAMPALAASEAVEAPELDESAEDGAAPLVETVPTVEAASTVEAAPAAGMPPGAAPLVPMIVNGELVLPKRKRGRPRKEEVLARQALLAAQAQAESGYPIPGPITAAPASAEQAPRRRGRPRKVDLAQQSTDHERTEAVVAAAMESLFGHGGHVANGGVNGDAEEGHITNGVNGTHETNGAGHHDEARVEVDEVISAAGAEEEPMRNDAEVEEVEERDEERGFEGGGQTSSGFNVGITGNLPLTKNQRRELRRRELERIRRESGLS